MNIDSGISLLELPAGNFRNVAGDAEQLPVPSYFAHKAVFTRCAALAAIVAIGPILLLLMLLVRITSRGPALFHQARVGQGGKIFNVIKIRTMYENAEKHTGPVWCTHKDPRITPVGNFYRFLHLDELPQLINVLKGEMCLIGPRPERPEIIARDHLMRDVPGYEERSRVLPGITGLAQINLPPDETIECVRRKVKLDLLYIEQASPWLDFRILVCTALRMCGLRHGIAAKLLKVQYSVKDLPAITSGLTVELQDTEFQYTHFVSTRLSPTVRLHRASWRNLVRAALIFRRRFREIDESTAPLSTEIAEDEIDSTSYESVAIGSKEQFLVNKPR